jgi:hypothetical protein
VKECQRDTLQPATGWWLFYGPGAVLDSSIEEYLTKKVGEWEGGVSVMTMTVDHQGNVKVVKDDLSDYGIHKKTVK